jgi:hypothetical protein
LLKEEAFNECGKVDHEHDKRKLLVNIFLQCDMVELEMEVGVYLLHMRALKK